MPSTAKENDTLSSTADSAGRGAGLPGDTAIKHQPVALEVPVTVNGARTVEGSDKREPFSESTKTVLVFGNGAVLRLASSVAPGQLLFLTNEKTKKEVVCQVVKSKNYRNVSGYVEVEFTESVVGFWGMRFPSDRIGSSAPPLAPAPISATSPLASGTSSIPATPPAKPAPPAARATEAPALPKMRVPVAPVSSTPEANSPAALLPTAPIAAVSALPESKLDPVAPMPVGPLSPAFELQQVSESKASIFEPPPQAAAPSTLNLASLAPFFEVKPSADSPAPPPPAALSHDPETEALKHQTARLQEQLSTPLFTEAAPAPPGKPEPAVNHTPPVEKKERAETAARLSEIAEAPEPSPLLPKHVETANPAPTAPKSSFDDPELKIPAWLEPLARNAAAPVSTQELIEREKAKRLLEQRKIEETAAEPAAAVEEDQRPEVPLPTFGNTLPIDDAASAGESASRRSGRGVLFAAVAAAILLLVAGGWWYVRQQSGGSLPASAAVKPTSAIPAPVAALEPQSQSNEAQQVNAPAQTNSGVQIPQPTQTKSALNPASVGPANVSAAKSRNPQPSSNPLNGGALVPASVPVPEVSAQGRKPVLGEVHLSAPKVIQKRTAQNAGEAEAGLALNEELTESNPDSLNSGLTVGNGRPVAPAAPVAVGGEVKQAKLLSSVAPVYPMLAKNQHVSGNVLVDALIDPNGRVTTMKIVSGPTLLHQAAMDALRQWKYQPAMLDGKPVPMHLTVTIQFRLQ